VANVAGAFILVRLDGAAGAARALFMAYLLNVLIMWWLARQRVPLPGL
jgi:Na+-driven multidrug efflux pump